MQKGVEEKDDIVLFGGVEDILTSVPIRVHWSFFALLAYFHVVLSHGDSFVSGMVCLRGECMYP